MGSATAFLIPMIFRKVQTAIVARDVSLLLVALFGFLAVTLATLMRRRLFVTGSTLRARTVEQKTAVVDAVRDRVWPLFETGELRPVIHQRLPLAQAAEAHHLMEASTHIGKLLLVM